MSVLVVDGYNVIHALPELRQKMSLGLEAARQGLVALCRRYRDSRRDVEKVVIVFDGRGGGLTRESVSPGIEVMYTRRREEADDRILELIRTGAGKSFVIVSNDTYVFNNCRAHGAAMMNASSLSAAPGAPPGPGRAPRSAAPPDKPDPSRKEARDITDEYRKHLGL